MRHIMFDIETLGTSPGAPVLSIGAVRFELGDIPPLLQPDITEASKHIDPDQFYVRIGLDSNLRAGLNKITQGSLDFWFIDADAEARLDLTRKRADIRTALGAFWKWVDKEEYEGIWAHGTTFDVPLLQEAYHKVYDQDRVPWRYRSIRDTRTLFEIAYPSQRVPEPKGSKALGHIALFDAYNQAKMVQVCYERLNNASSN